MTQNQQKFLSALPESWQDHLVNACSKDSIDRLVTYLQKREVDHAIIYPEKKNIFAALNETPFDKVKIVIVGQDPYHGPGQAQGLSFSVPKGLQIPPSLRNIFKELQTDIGIPIPKNGCLTSWAQQGVLLLNAILTVEKGLPASHHKRGWEDFTDEIVVTLLQRNKPVVFMLWGSYAQKKIKKIGIYINPKKHLILQAAHPSPLSIRGFLGCRHFSQANAFLKKHSIEPIDWTKISY